MKNSTITKSVLALFVLLMAGNILSAQATPQNEAAPAVQFDGLYVAKTGTVNIPNNKMEIYTYIRFYPDGTVYTQTVSSFDPAKVAVWFGKGGRFERKGNYAIKGTAISFDTNNDESPDKAIEGAMRTGYSGSISTSNKLYLQIKYDDGEVKDFWFEFTKVN